MDMDDLSLPRTDTERYAVCGWSALERGDLAEARAALQNLYDADPTHPALPLLAAGIRRIRPRPLPWRAAVLLLLIIGAGTLAFWEWNRDAGAGSAAKAAVRRSNVASIPQSTAEPQSTAPAEVRSEVGTSGSPSRTELPSAKQNTSSVPGRDTSSAAVDEDLVVRQVIQRFEGTYRNRWGGLAFEHCDISRERDQAIALCTPRTATQTSDAEADRVWKFSLHKDDGTWRIVSAQPPPDSVR
jgi:hypothetical protein